MPSDDKFTFAISLSVLDHLGRNLYRSFATVIGEAISNAWDADAKNVHIYIDDAKRNFFIKDDGVGMTASDFQDKFLRIGYSKRIKGEAISPKGRPYIGRKGIGKLALLSCAERVTVISKIKGKEYIGGVIDNSGLDEAITHDLEPDEYPLQEWKLSTFKKHADDHKHGTIIYFDGVKDGIRNSLAHLKKIIALYFRFSLLDGSFNIYVNDELITFKHLDDLAQNTEFVWVVNDFQDPYVKGVLKRRKEPGMPVKMKDGIGGFIASVGKPRDLKIEGTDERVTLDLFVNGRLREKDILKHIPTARVAESYLYGQIHFNGLDDKTDRFTSSREGVVADDTKYKSFLDDLRKRILTIVSAWDRLRIDRREDGDPENERFTKKERKSLELFGAVSRDYRPPKSSKRKKEVDGWVDDLKYDAAYNFESYAECFVSENLVRRYIHEKKLAITPRAQTEINEWKTREVERKEEANINIDIRRKKDDLSYLDLSFLAGFVDLTGVPNSLNTDAKAFRPIRNAVMHTALLTDVAKRKLTTIYENIEGRIRALLA